MPSYILSKCELSLHCGWAMSMCVFRCAAWPNDLLHWTQTYGLSLLWVSMWIFRCAARPTTVNCWKKNNLIYSARALWSWWPVLKEYKSWRGRAGFWHFLDRVWEAWKAGGWSVDVASCWSTFWSELYQKDFFIITYGGILSPDRFPPLSSRTKTHHGGNLSWWEYAG